MIKILMIEDDLELAEILTEFLAKSDMDVTTAEEPYIGLSTLNVEKFDLVILDLTLPGLDGLEVCKEIRKRHDVPIIISSARHDITDKVNALDNGADDYLPKPYDPQELLARIKSHLRRQSAVAGANLSGAKESVREKEGGAITREEFIYNCASISEDSTNKSIDVIIGRIRGKLGDDPKEPKYIHAIRGIGYKLMQ